MEKLVLKISLIGWMASIGFRHIGRRLDYFRIVSTIKNCIINEYNKWTWTSLS